MKIAIFAAVLLLAACGKVGETLPPIIRIPQKIDKLSAVQSGYTVFLNWMNPSKYIDGNPATDTGMVHVFRNNMEIGMVAATAAGQPQSFPVDVKSRVGESLVFTIQLVVPKASKPSPISNAAPIQVVDVPGSPRNPSSTVDLGKIVLEWAPPELHPELVDAYIVQRSDKPPAAPVRVPRFEDTEYERDKTYTYTITAVRANPQIPGEGGLTHVVVATDKNPPAIPKGLSVQLLNNVVFVQWEQNTEPDWKDYQLFRSDRPGVPLVTTVANGYTDGDYVPGKGISYRILAEDVSGNPSPLSAPTPGP